MGEGGVKFTYQRKALTRRSYMGRKSLLYIIWALKSLPNPNWEPFSCLDNNHMYKCQVICLSLFEQQQSCRQVVSGEGKRRETPWEEVSFSISLVYSCQELPCSFTYVKNVLQNGFVWLCNWVLITFLRHELISYVLS